MGSGDDGHVVTLPASPESVQAASSLAELLPDGLVVVGGDGIIRFVNREACRILRRASEEMVARPALEALPLSDKYGRDWWQHTDPWTGPSTRTRHRERLLVGPDGRDVLVTARYIRAEGNGRLQRMLVGLRDAEARLRAERDQATVLSTVAHELRAPLTSVTGFTSSLLRRWDRFTDEQKRLMIETIESDASRLTRLITELLDISRLDSDSLSLRLTPVDLHELLAAHVGRHELSRTGGQVLLRLGPSAQEHGLPEVWADTDRLQQVFFNLIENALRHGAAPVTVTLDRDAPDGDTVLVLVDDRGAGIAPEDRDKVFGRFWRGSDGATTGLGLYVVRGLVEAHGGSVSVESNPLGGARFAVRLPAGVPDAVALP
ncbi:ATP-binding protein [Intrasporangium sp.]|uniref:PAS domain-containing sensor histidine kinase n=1 Tax=Intrasporangium sp. TaxID=1925024 RepID=UPI0029398248|nr:ATP-binding protein [Intrasporangium sp.]MDV3222326.1 PAS domain-containing protein [Intrasporangium sp.]